MPPAAWPRGLSMDVLRQPAAPQLQTVALIRLQMTGDLFRGSCRPVPRSWHRRAEETPALCQLSGKHYNGRKPFSAIVAFGGADFRSWRPQWNREPPFV